jgi:hypothetical protein
MSERSEHIVRQVQILWHGAVGELGGVAGHMVRNVAARIAHESSRPMDGLLDRALKQSARLAEGEALPLPSTVRSALGRLNQAIETRVGPQTASTPSTSEEHPLSAPSETAPQSRPAQQHAASEATEGEQVQARPARKRRPRRRKKPADAQSAVKEG